MKKLIGLMLLVLVLLSGSVMSKTVVVLQSYHAEYSWTADIDKGATKALEGSGTEIKFLYMDLKRNPGDEAMNKAVEKAKADIDALKPAVVITGDDAAQLVAKDYANKDGAPAFVFCGVNAELDKYGFPAKNITGILERAYYVSSLRMIQKIKPVKTVAIIGDASNTDVLVMSQIKKEKTDLGVELVGTANVATLEEFQKAVADLQGKADVIGFLTCRSIKKVADDAKAMDGKDVIAWVVENCKKPTIGFWDYDVKEGALCGITPSGEEHGFLAGKMAKQIIDGKSPADIPVAMAEKGAMLINLKTAKTLGIPVPYELIKTAQVVIKE